MSLSEYKYNQRVIMIATILRSSSSFNAVEYNEAKVSKGVAELIEIKNFDLLQNTGNVTASNLQEYLINYSSQNDNIKKPQFHLAISCKKDECDYDELVRIAHQYLKEMGYGEEGQPLLIYAHYDTSNHHIHIVTSRINPQGKKIDHDNERLRSQAVINKIMGVKPKQDVKSIVQRSLGYSYENLGQFQAILESNGYESYTEGDNLNIKKGGTVIENILIAKIEKHTQKRSKEETQKRRMQLKAILLKYRDITSNKEELNAVLKKKFGVSLVFMGKKDTPYGYIIVDHKEKATYKGKDVLGIKDLLRFKKEAVTEENKDEIATFIHNLLEENKRQTIAELNEKLWRKYKVNVYHDGFVRDRHYKMVSQVNAKDFETLRYNFKVQWIQSFNPSTEEERAILCKFGHIEDVNDILIKENNDVDKINSTINHIKSIVDSEKTDSIYKELNRTKIVIIRKEDTLHAIDIGASTIVNLNETDIDITNLKRHSSVGVNASVGIITNRDSGQTQIAKVESLLNTKDTGHHSNREWEVGGSDNWDDIDDERKLRQ